MAQQTNRNQKFGSVPWPYFAHLVVLAAAYYGTGKLGLMLAIPPGYATAVWPASGIALAGALLLGKRIWPAIVVGSFLVNIGNSLDTTSTSAIFNSIALAASIGFGAALRAVIGVHLIQRSIGFSNSLNREKDIIKFLVLGGLVSSLENATWGTGSLMVAGVVQPADAAFGWWTWHFSR